MMMASAKSPLIILGRFPPPLDGQSISTARLAELLEPRYNCTLVNSSVTSSFSVLAKVAAYRKTSRELKIALNNNPDALVAWLSISPQTAGHLRDCLLFLPIIHRRSVIAVVHWGLFANVFTNLHTRFTARKLPLWVNRFVFTDQLLSDACAGWIPSHQRSVIPNTLDEAVRASANEVETKRTRLKDDERKVLFLSNMITEKGYEDVLEAAALLKHHQTRFTFTFAGSWPSERARISFMSKIVHLGLSDEVQVIGSVSDRAKVKILHLESDIFILPSYLGEAQPLSIIEAMAAGSAVVVSNQGGMPAMTDRGRTGSIVEPRNPVQIRDALSELCDRDVWLDCSKNARSIFDSTFGDEMILDRWVELIDGGFLKGKARS